MNPTQKLIEAAEALLSNYEASPCPDTCLVTQVRSAVRGLREAGEPVAWQPIETAPQDGSEVLVYATVSDEQFVAYWWDDGWSFAPGVQLKSPTHWMPLPAAPGATPPSPAPQPAQDGGEVVAFDDCRISLVTALHMLASDFENALYKFDGDDEARRAANGSIAHARKVAARWNWNGAALAAADAQKP